MTAKKTNPDKAAKAPVKCDGQCRCAACAANKPEARKIDLEKVGETAKDAVRKIPQWLSRLVAELEKLLERLAKLQAVIGTLEGLVARKEATKEQKEELKLLRKQEKAMRAYADVLQQRKAKGGC